MRAYVTNITIKKDNILCKSSAVRGLMLGIYYYAHIRIKEYDQPNIIFKRGALSPARRFLLRIGGPTAAYVDLCTCGKIEDCERANGGAGGQPAFNIAPLEDFA